MKEYTEEDFLSYLEKIYKKTGDKRLRNPEVKKNSLSLLYKACKITNLSVSDLLNKIDFNQNDLSIEALESLFAILRAPIWLQHFDFSEITPLKKKKKRRQPDFKAKYKERIAVTEVFCLTQKYGQPPCDQKQRVNYYENFDPQFEGSKFGRDFKSKAPDKKKQLDSKSADIKVLLCVVNSDVMVSLNTNEEWNKHAKLLYEKLSWGNSYYIGIMAGAEKVIYPSLKNYEEV